MDRAPRGDRAHARPRRARVRVQLVTRYGGVPIPEVTIAVHAYPGLHGGTVREPFDLADVATTDASGIAEFDRAPIGQVRLRLSHGLDAGTHEIGGDETLIVAVDRVAIVQGIVRDGKGKPVAGAKIWTLRPDGSSELGCFYPGLAVAATARDGTFRVVLVDSVTTRMWATSWAGRSAVADLSLEQPLVDGVVFRLLPAPGVLRGTVVDRLGHPVRNALVMAYPEHGPQPSANLPAWPDPRGRFVLRSLLPGRYWVVAMAPKGAFATRQIEVTTAEPITVSLAVSRGGRISGQATDARGDPLAGACVVAAPEPKVYRRSKLLARLGWTASDGSFDLPAVPQGSVVLGVVDPSTGRAVVAVRKGLLEGQALRWQAVARSGAAADVELARYVESVYHSVMPIRSGASVLESSTAAK